MMGKLNELINQYTIGKGMLYSVPNSIKPTLPVKNWDRNKLSFSISKSTNRKFVAISDFTFGYGFSEQEAISDLFIQVNSLWDYYINSSSCLTRKEQKFKTFLLENLLKE